MEEDRLQRSEKYRRHKDQKNKNNQKTKMERKTTAWTFQAINKRNLTRKNLDMAKKRKPQERNWISSDSSTKRRHHDYVKAKIDKTQQNNRCRLNGERDETINHIISECSIFVQRAYKTRHDWVEKVIHWELSKKLKFDHTNKWYMHNLESVLDNETHNSLGFWDTNG